MNSLMETLGLTFSIFRRELLAIPRRKRFYLKRAAFLAFAGYFLLHNYFLYSDSRGSAIGLSLFMPLAIATLVAALLMTPTAASSLVMREREERTLGLLFLSEISGSRFVIGKLLTSLFSMGSLILSTLPFFILVVSFGGVSVEQVILAFAILASASLLGASIGLLGACSARTQRKCDLIIGVLLITYFGAFPVSVAVAYELRGGQIAAVIPLSMDTALSVISPCVAMYHICEGRILDHGILNCVANIFLSLPLLFLARLLVTRTIVSKEKPPISETIKGRVRSLLRLKNLFAVPPVEGNPVCWRDFHLSGGGHRSAFFKFVLSLSVPVGILLIYKTFITEYSWQDFFGFTLGFSVFISVTAAALGTIHGLGGAFVKDRQSRSLEILLTTDLSSDEIIGGKVRAVVYSVLPWIIAAPVFGLFIFISVVSTSASPMWNNGMDIVLYTFLDFGAIFFCFSAFALWLSLRTKKNHALAICILTTILSSLFCRPFILLVSLDNTFGMGSRFLMPFLDAAVHIVIGASFLANARSNFRATVLKHMG